MSRRAVFEAAGVTISLVAISFAVLIICCHANVHEKFDVFQDLENWVENPVAMSTLYIARSVSEFVCGEFRKVDRLIGMLEGHVRETAGEKYGRHVGVGEATKIAQEPPTIFLPWQLLFFVTVLVYGLFFAGKSAKVNESKKVDDKRANEKKSRHKKERRRKKSRKRKRQ